MGASASLFRKGKCPTEKDLDIIIDIFTEMGFYSELLNTAVKSIKGEEEEKASQTVFDFLGFNNSFKNDTADDFELISFLVVG